MKEGVRESIVSGLSEENQSRLARGLSILGVVPAEIVPPTPLPAPSRSVPIQGLMNYGERAELSL